ncbi:MAG: 1-deoxy-D-xylulose-5-phosphate synthase [Bacteroidota bacterium]
MSLLHTINSAEDVSLLGTEDLLALSHECRQFLIDTILKHGGHFAGNLGVVELTVALLKVFNPADDPIIWDVGHQSYAYKVLTGRREHLKSIRSYGGIAGFPKRGENPADHFGTGHSSTAISAALGMAMASKIIGNDNNTHIAIVGDGALSGGMSFEALNNAAASKPNLLIIINDNQISIDAGTGAMNEHLANIQPGEPNLFTALNLDYHGPIDGHDLPLMLEKLQHLKSLKHPRVLHIKTTKGKGHAPAEAEQTKWHSTGKFVKIEARQSKESSKWHEVAGQCMLDIAKQHRHVAGITPAMPSGSGLVNCFQTYPDRFFDTGIAEQHAVTFAAGLAASGIKPFLFIYSTFLQRGYDQVIHDIALQNLPVVICIDRAGLVGEDGPTHHGAFDIPMLRCIPGLTILAPATATELYAMMQQAVYAEHPIVIRYPKGPVPELSWEFHREEMLTHPGLCLKEGEHTAVISTGNATALAHEAFNINDTPAAHYHFPAIHPLRGDLFAQIGQHYAQIITVEDGCIAGGFGESVSQYLYQQGFTGKITHLGIPDAFITHGSNDILYDECGYSPEKIAKAIQLSFSQ